MNKSLEYVKNQIAKLKDDLQHFTMVEKDSALASQIRYDLEQFETIEKELKDYEEMKHSFNVITCENGDLLKYKQALDFIKENALYIDWLGLFSCIVDNWTYEGYEGYCEAVKETTYADEEEYNLFKEVLL